ncbi:uncharacterized protein N7479_011047 [Penicillium vulpinum]|uniref:uncharacterized protein n=1 Tax=Penicillium vulpinum TaxID=29845 RepID=UPI0025483377|nr:uncharacterized protein N7479_011047 [Penicillium vulpinum]KAJ5952634.1 hypothetical protein N7479_011047 [Penicillium vulpinum]
MRWRQCSTSRSRQTIPIDRVTRSLVIYLFPCHCYLSVPSFSFLIHPSSHLYQHCVVIVL